MARFITEHFVPVRLHVRDQAADFRKYGERFDARWTPTILVLDPEGVEQHRIEGFLPADDLIAQLMLGLAHGAFKHQQWGEAARRFAGVAEQLPESDSAAEAAYWMGVSRYKETNDPAHLAHTAEVFSHRYQNTPWAKKASVWMQPAA